LLISLDLLLLESNHMEVIIPSRSRLFKTSSNEVLYHFEAHFKLSLNMTIVLILRSPLTSIPGFTEGQIKTITLSLYINSSGFVIFTDFLSALPDR